MEGGYPEFDGCISAILHSTLYGREKRIVREFLLTLKDYPIRALSRGPGEERKLGDGQKALVLLA